MLMRTLSGNAIRRKAPHLHDTKRSKQEQSCDKCNAADSLKRHLSLRTCIGPHLFARMVSAAFADLTKFRAVLTKCLPSKNDRRTILDPAANPQCQSRCRNLIERSSQRAKGAPSAKALHAASYPFTNQPHTVQIASANIRCVHTSTRKAVSPRCSVLHRGLLCACLPTTDVSSSMGHPFSSPAATATTL